MRLWLCLCICVGMLEGAWACSSSAPPPAAAPTTTTTPVDRPVLPSDPNKRVSILILPLHTEVALQSTGRALDEMILTSVGRLHLYQVMGPEDINALLGVDRLKDAAGCDDTSCATQLAGALGAPYLIAGQLTQLGDDVVLSLRLMDTKAATVLGRASGRGAPVADSLSQVTSDALHDLLGVEIPAVHETRVSTTLSGRPALYGEYQAMLSNLSRLMSNLEYTQLLTTLDDYEKKPPIEAPPGQDARELLVFYRATACYALKRAPCVEGTAQRYLKTWPSGVYARSMQSYIEQLATLKAKREEQQVEMQERLATIEQRRAAGKITEPQALDQTARTYLGGQAYELAAGVYQKLLARPDVSEDNWFTYAAEQAMALENIGDFAGVRKLLESARGRNEQLFRRRGMNQTLARLPK